MIFDLDEEINVQDVDDGMDGEIGDDEGELHSFPPGHPHHGMTPGELEEFQPRRKQRRYRDAASRLEPKFAAITEKEY